MHYERLASLILDTAVPNGARQVDDLLSTFQWDVGAHCDDPFSRTLHARRDYKAEHGFRVNPGSLTLHLTGLPCRKCEKCRAVRGTEWRRRIRTELDLWPRTWFVTLTFRPVVHFHMHMMHLAKKNRAGWLDSDFTDGREWKLRCEAAGEQFTTYLKRVRKVRAGEGPVRFKYLCAFEPHSEELAGLPHIHALVHEVAGPVTWRRLSSRWDLGWMTAKLVGSSDDVSPAKVARYVSKYLTKGEIGPRVRASRGYGHASGLSLPDALDA